MLAMLVRSLIFPVAILSVSWLPLIDLAFQPRKPCFHLTQLESPPVSRFRSLPKALARS